MLCVVRRIALHCRRSRVSGARACNCRFSLCCQLAADVATTVPGWLFCENPHILIALYSSYTHIYLIIVRRAADDPLLGRFVWWAAAVVSLPVLVCLVYMCSFEATLLAAVAELPSLAAADDVELGARAGGRSSASSRGSFAQREQQASGHNPTQYSDQYQQQPPQQPYQPAQHGYQPASSTEMQSARWQ